MSKRYNQVATQVDSPIWPGAGWVDLLSSGLVIGVMLWAILLACGAAAYILWGWWAQKWPLLSGLMSLVASGGVVIWRMLEPERVAKVNNYNMRILREQNRAEFASMYQTAGDVIEGREPTASRRDQVFRRMMRRHYAGWPITREACVKSGMCTFAEWNAVSQLMASRGIKRDRSILPQTRTDALRVWYDAEDKARRFRFVDGEPVAKE